MRIVLDTNVLVRAAASQTGPAADLLDAIVSNAEHTLILSPFILDEVDDVLSRPYFRARVSGLERLAFRAQLASASRLVIPGDGPAIVESDPADDAVFYTAAAGRADVICTRNAKHFRSGSAMRFCAERRIRVLGDLELLGELRGEVDR